MKAKRGRSKTYPYIDLPLRTPRMELTRRMTMSDIKYEIVKKIGVLSKSASGWEKQLNLVSWNDRDPKYDIREWSPDGEKMGKGVTLSREELVT